MTKSKPARIADEIEAADRGWGVERLRDGDMRTVRARREGESVLIAWFRNDAGRDVFMMASHNRGVERELFTNVAAKIREMTAPPAVPFDPATASVEEIVAAVIGRTIEFTNSITGKTTTARVSQPTVQQNGPRSTLTFSDGRCFRSVYLDAIERVS